jgi:hypothetical protein
MVSVMDPYGRILGFLDRILFKEEYINSDIGRYTTHFTRERRKLLHLFTDFNSRI